MKVNQLKAGIILSYLSMFVSTAISMIYTPFMLRLLGQNEYGLYSLSASVISYLGLLGFGFGSTFVRYYSRYKANGDEEGMAKLNGMFLVIFSVIALLSILAGSVLILNAERFFKQSLTVLEIQKSKILMSIMVFNVSLSFITSIFETNVTANERYIFQKSISLLRSLLSPLLTLMLLFMGLKSIALTIAITIFTIANLIANIFFCFKKLQMRFILNQFDKSLMKEISIFSSFIFLNIIVDQVSWSTDKFILGMFRGTADVAIYGVAAQLNAYYMSFATSISSVFIPKINRMVSLPNQKEQLNMLFIKVGRMQFIVLSLILSGFIIFGKFFISVWAGSEYSDTYYVTLLLIIPLTIPLIQNLALEIQRAKNMHRFRSVVGIATAILHIFISVALVDKYGAIGCAVGTALSLFIGNGVILNWYYNKYLGLNIAKFWVSIAKFIPALAVCSVLGFCITHFRLVSSITSFLFFAAIFVICFIVCMWLFAMNKSEKQLFTNPLIRVKEKLIKQAE